MKTKMIGLTICLLVGLGLNYASLSAADPTKISDANTSLTFTAGAAQAHCQALTQDTNTDWVVPSVQEAMIFAGDANDSEYVWTDTVGDFTTGGNISNPFIGNWVTVRLSNGDIRLERAPTARQTRCVR